MQMVGKVVKNDGSWTCANYMCIQSFNSLDESASGPLFAMSKRISFPHQLVGAVVHSRDFYQNHLNVQ